MRPGPKSLPGSVAVIAAPAAPADVQTPAAAVRGGLPSPPARMAASRLPSATLTPEPAAADAESSRQAGRPPAVLVVDDDDLVRSGVMRSLARLGYETSAVSGAEEALDLLRSGRLKIDLVFTDIRMPGAIDGVELARIVRQEFPRVAILLTTGFAGRTRAPEARVLYKPYKLADLARAIRESLGADVRPA